MAVLENRPSKTLGFLHVFSSENDLFNTLLGLNLVFRALTGASTARAAFGGAEDLRPRWPRAGMQ